MQKCWNLLLLWICMIEQFLDGHGFLPKPASTPANINKYTFITQQSYDKFLVYLDDTCQVPEQHNADVTVNHVDDRYFEWEQFNFNKALLHYIFPGTEESNFAKILKPDQLKTLDDRFFVSELPTNCTSSENDWTFTAKEPDVFQDNLINWVFNTDRENY
ncbi:unnamed protein product [Bursaphelenchus okinawaensis]|uniref:Uncharacterized protein n=1 Tax=Bursaphelenchus okinawaensis TaxID=465554 RepID=A0A811KCU1_9BILA|nr:unnamed protein product [Bursaphelenchus okinawaensis]CAG9099484.1 unnamed protein product [Bursaphelenchus okinawaensis]